MNPLCFILCSLENLLIVLAPLIFLLTIGICLAVFEQVSKVGKGFRKIVINSRVADAKSNFTNFWYGVLFFALIGYGVAFMVYLINK